MLFTGLAFAADVATLRAGLAAESGWAELDRKTLAGLGEVVVRHKRIGETNCLEGSALVADVSVDSLLREATDVVRQPSWSSQAVVASVKLSSGATRFDYYQVLDNPSPVADRYWFVQATSSTEGAGRVFAWEQIDAETRYPDAVVTVLQKWPDAVSTRVNVGDWTFTPVEGGARVRYRICTDAGGNLPSWVGQLAARTTLPTNLSDIVRRVRAVDR
jgi:hypothetical protein